MRTNGVFGEKHDARGWRGVFTRFSAPLTHSTRADQKTRPEQVLVLRPAENPTAVLMQASHATGPKTKVGRAKARSTYPTKQMLVRTKAKYETPSLRAVTRLCREMKNPEPDTPC